MSKELDTSWFDLKKYDELSELDLSGWHTQIETRNIILNATQIDLDDDDNDRDLELIKKMQKNPIWRDRDGNVSFEWEPHPNLVAYPFNTYSVYSTPTIEMWFERHSEEGDDFNDTFSDIFRLCEEYDYRINPERDALIYTPYDFLYQKIGIEPDEANVRVNLTATDEQILSDFKHWLTEYRKATGYESRKNNFTDKDLACWYNSRLLPYIDLMLSAEIEGKKITDAKIASLIFPDERNVDIVDKLRRTVRPKADWLLRNETSKAIEAQLSAFKGT